MTTALITRNQRRPTEVIQSKRYHLRDMTFKKTIMTFDTLEAANIRRDHEQSTSDHFRTGLEWYVVDTYA